MERILVIQFRMIGDVLLNTPVVRALRQHYPQSYLAYCTEPIPAQVLRNNPYLDDILIQPRPATWCQQLAMISRVRQQRFDLVVDLMGNPRSALLTLLSGARHRLAFARFPRSLCYNHLVARTPEIVDYTVLERLRLLAPLGIHTTDIALDMVYTDEERAEVAAFLQRHGITPHDLLICVDPTSYVPTREWPGAYFSQLADLLHQRLGARVCLLWGPGEEAKVQAIAAAATSQPLLNPPWELTHLAALLDRTDFFVGNDSAPKHIAVSQGTPTLSITGAQNHVNWVSPEAQHQAVFAGLPCQPCFQRHCGPPLDIACMRTLSVDTVFDAVQALKPWVPKLK
ncbi:glycosyltransferase family 9 protein [Candidatus Entotheonella palauensis]|uniref:glycosyltransferase family 9 protein n=1 Tax=Candidatus Entotheonella palauensis TaxID=93172 RepID=UPI000B7EE102|nr:glycosyltransferase family 9 protein [Candidatus Entotheonella palauensis]